MLHLLQFYIELDESCIGYKKKNIIEKFKPYVGEDFITVAQAIKSRINSVYIFVDVVKMLEKREITEIDYTICEAKINAYLKRNKLSLDDLTLIKLEYRYDYVTKSKAERKMYMEALCKGLNKVNRKTKNVIGDDGFIPTLYYKNKSVIAKVYCKEEEHIAKGKMVTELEADVIRFELTLNNKHLNNQKQYKNSSKTLKTYMNAEKYKKYMLNDFEKIVYKGDFYGIEEAKRRILISNLKESQKNKLVDNIKYIRHYGLNNLKKKLSDSTFRAYVMKMNEIEVNPLTFKQNNGGQALINPIKILREELNKI